MGSSPSPYADFQPPPLPLPLGYEQRREPKTRYIILFLLTLLTTTLAGESHYLSFILGFDAAADTSYDLLFWNGLWYSIPVIAILGSHEMGHYLACRYYRVDASRPYFIPFFIPFIGPLLFGTLGAVIRIRQPIPGKRPLFDIGIAGPIAGFLVLVPVLAIGMYLSKVIPVPEDFKGQIVEIGEPLLFRLAAWLTFGQIPDGYTVSMHPVAFAAWFGMLATSLNLFPIGQLDGGHISYAVLGPRSTIVTITSVVLLVAISFVSSSLILFAALIVGMIALFGPRHPRVFDEDVPLDPSRMWLALFAVIMFILCFTPAPIAFRDLVPGQ